MTPEELVGKEYVFVEDNSTLKIIQIKYRDVNGEVVPYVTYTTEQPMSLPRKLVMSYNDFIGHFGHLFET